jgi:hypothetical protein
MGDFSRMTPEQRRGARRYTPRLAGVHEAAELLGLTKQRLSQLARDPTFPAALALLHSGPAWDLSDLEAEAARRRQRRALALRA